MPRTTTPVRRILEGLLLLTCALQAHASSLLDLPVMQYHTGALNILYANAIRGADFRIVADPALLDANDFDENGWLKRFPAASGNNIWYYLPDGDKLHGVYVLTWEGEGTIEFKCPGNVEEVLLFDAVNRRIVARNPEGVKARIEIRAIDPANHIRNVKVWAPIYPGAGAGLTDQSDLSVGTIEGNLEPAPGEEEPLFHPLRLQTMAEGGAGVMRFMGFLGNINGSADSRLPTPAWEGRTPQTYGVVRDGNYSWDGDRESLTTLGRKGITGIPYEDIIDLCNALQRDLWVQVPHDTDAAYAHSLATLIEERLDPSLRVWAEYSNELWNSADSYLPQLTHARQAYADANGIPLSEVDLLGSQHAWGSGQVSANFLAAFLQGWTDAGADPDRCIRVISGWQAGSSYNTAMLASAREVGADLVDVFAITTYFGNSLAEDLVGLDYDDNGDASEAVYRKAARIIEQNLFDNIEPRWRTAVADFDIPVVAYEGGQHLTATGFINDNPGLSPFMANINRHPLMGDLYKSQWHLWRAAGAGTAALFTDLGETSTFGYWGAQENLFQESTPPKWQAYIDFSTSEASIRPIAHPLGNSPTLTTLSLQEGEVGIAYSSLLASSGGDGARTMELVGGIPPLGLTFTASANGSGTLQGTPQEIGIFPLLFRVVDADGDPDYQLLNIDIGPAGSFSNGLIDFRDSMIPEEMDFTREPTTLNSGLRDLWAFGIDNNSAFIAPDPLPAESDLIFYGGYDVVYTQIDGVPQVNNPFINPSLTPNRGWNAYHAGTQELTSEDYALFVWRKDQFNNHASSTVQFGQTPDQASLMLDTNGLGSNEASVRFVILNGSTWYISEAEWNSTQNGRFVLDAFNQNAEPGKRWAPFTPTSNDFTLPSPLPAFQAVDFNDVQAVGIWMYGKTNRYGWSHGFKRFLAIGTDNGSTAPPPTQYGGILAAFDFNGSDPGLSYPWTQALLHENATLTSGLSYGTEVRSSTGGMVPLAGDNEFRFALWNPNRIDDIPETASTLAQAIAADNYLSFTVDATSGTLPDLARAELLLNYNRYSTHAANDLTIFTSVGGFNEGQQIATFSDQVGPLITEFPSAGYSKLESIEVRIYLHNASYNSGHQSSLTALSLQARGDSFVPASWFIANELPVGLLGDGHPGIDTDRDGMDNLNEYLAGTHPDITTSVLKLQSPIMVDSQSLKLRWSSLQDGNTDVRHYNVMRATRLDNDPDWTKISGEIPPEGDLTEWIDPGPLPPAAFYKIEVAR